MRVSLGLLIAIYAALYATCYLCAFMLRLEFDLSSRLWGTALGTLPTVLAVKMAVWLAMREWRRRHRYTTLGDMLSIATGVSASAFLLSAFKYRFGLGIPNSVLVIDAMLTFLGTGLLRASARIVNERRWRGNSGSPALILGTDSEAVELLHSLRVGSREYRAVGLISSSTGTRRDVIAGVPAFGLDALEEAARRLGARHLLIPARHPGAEVRTLVRRCQPLGITAHVIPSVVELVAGRYQVSVREVTISDLLRREPAALDFTSIRGYLSGKRVLVTGGAGSIGSEICRQVLALGPESLVIFDQSEFGVFSMEQEFAEAGGDDRVRYVVGDVRDRDALDRAMLEHAPQVVFHAAAYKHVPLMEQNPREAILNNVFGTKNAIDAAALRGVETLVLISTDKAVRPSNVMGSTKLLAEKYLQAAAARSSARLVTVRFGNVLNSMGSVVPTFRRQIERGGPITVTHPETERYFMTIPEAVQLVLQAGAVGDSGDLLVLDMGEPVKIVDLAKDLIHLSGMRFPEDIDIVFTGLRPGEKLVEELLYDSESDCLKVRDGILRVARKPVDMLRLERELARLREALGGDRDEALAALRDIVGRHAVADEAPHPARMAA